MSRHESRRGVPALWLRPEASDSDDPCPVAGSTLRVADDPGRVAELARALGFPCRAPISSHSP